MVSSSSSALIAGQPLSLSTEGVVSSSLANHGPGAYRVILCDPPWKFKVFSKKGLGKSAERHYQTLEYAAIVELLGGVEVADDCVLFLWVTDPMLEKGLNQSLIHI